MLLGRYNHKIVFERWLIGAFLSIQFVVLGAWGNNIQGICGGCYYVFLVLLGWSNHCYYN